MSIARAWSALPLAVRPLQADKRADELYKQVFLLSSSFEIGVRFILKQLKLLSLFSLFKLGSLTEFCV